MLLRSFFFCAECNLPGASRDLAWTWKNRIGWQGKHLSRREAAWLVV